MVNKQLTIVEYTIYVNDRNTFTCYILVIHLRPATKQMKKTIPGLNGLRAISIIIVIFSHLNLRAYEGKLVHGTHFLDGQFGVTIFFVLSGFLITTLLMREERQDGTISLGGFYFKRVLRIFPVYFMLLLAYKILQLSGALMWGCLFALYHDRITGFIDRYKEENTQQSYKSSTCGCNH